jgi:hypothetical protein
MSIDKKKMSSIVCSIPLFASSTVTLAPPPSLACAAADAGRECAIELVLGEVDGAEQAQ